MPGTFRRWLPRLGILVLGAGLSLAFPEASWWWLGWLGLAPAFMILARAPTRGEALVRSWFGGMGFLLALHHWLIPHMGLFTLPAAGFAGLFWVPIGLAVWSFLGQGRAAEERGTWAPVVVPAVWVAVEGVRAWEYLGGTWGLWGSSQWQVLPILQAAALGGVWLLSFAAVSANAALALAVLPRVGRRRRTWALAVALLIPSLLALGGAVRPEPPVSGTFSLAGVQPGVIDSDRERFQAHVELTEALDPATFDVVVWGQSSVAFDPEVEPEVDRALRRLAGEVGTDLLVNVDAEVGEGRIMKVVVQYTERGPVARYAKQRLVPFGEYIPLRPVFGWVAGFTEAAVQDRARGEELLTMSVQEVAIGPLVSYESTFPGMRRRLALLGADLTVVQGGTWTFQGTWAQPQQASFEAVRAVESGRPAVLVAVSGTSAAFDARGRQLAWVPAEREVAFLVDVPLSQEATPYVRLGDWVLWLSWAITILAAGVGMRSRLRSGGVERARPTEGRTAGSTDR